MYLLIICGQWVCVKIYSELIVSSARFLFGFLSNVAASFDAHLQSATHYGMALSLHMYGMPQMLCGAFRCTLVLSRQ